MSSMDEAESKPTPVVTLGTTLQTQLDAYKREFDRLEADRKQYRDSIDSILNRQRELRGAYLALQNVARETGVTLSVEEEVSG